MTTQVLIEAIVRQATILIAHLATAGGSRTPLGAVATQVFAELARELERQGVSRRVAADMFGVALRTYRRRIQRLAESETVLGRSLWEAVHEFIASRHVVTRAEVAARFHKDDGELIRGILQDLVDGGLVYRAGRGETASYRAATTADLEHVERTAQKTESIDTLVWAMVYREGPATRETLADRISVPPTELDAALERLLEAGRIVRSETEGRTHYGAENYLMPLGTSLGWEAAVFDHFQAVTTTLCARVGSDEPPAHGDSVGGSTYTLEVWPGHPFEAMALGVLKRFRTEVGELRMQIAAYNQASPLPRERSRVVVYGGQCVVQYEENGLEAD